ncbi:MAG: outer membrane beta-barrel protein [Candidatus Aminicenantales bacterium]
MKRWIRSVFVLLILLSFGGGKVRAQDFGVKMFYNFARTAWINPTGSEFHEEYANKYSLGPYLELRFILHLSVSAEFLLAKKGGIISLPGLKGQEYRLTYLSFPFMLNLYVYPVGTVQLFVSGGLEYSRLMKGVIFDLDLETEVQERLGSKLRKTDVSYLFGFGFLIDLDITKVRLEGRYSVSLRDFVLPQFLAEGESLKNRLVSFGISIKLN